MAKTKRPYTRLTPTRSMLGGYASLWLAEDHLLHVQSTGYSERYQRFYLRDIRGLFILTSQRRSTTALVWGLIALFTIISAGLGSNSWILVGVLTGLFAIPLGWNQLLGPGCTLHIVTGVQTARLEAVVRWRRAEKLLARLQPLIEAAQQDLAAPVVVVAAPPPLPVEPTVVAPPSVG